MGKLRKIAGKLQESCSAVTKPPEASRSNTAAPGTREAPTSTRGGQAKSNCGKIAEICENCEKLRPVTHPPLCRRWVECGVWAAPSVPCSASRYRDAPLRPLRLTRPDNPQSHPRVMRGLPQRRDQSGFEAEGCVELRPTPNVMLTPKARVVCGRHSPRQQCCPASKQLHRTSKSQISDGYQIPQVQACFRKKQGQRQGQGQQQCRGRGRGRDKQKQGVQGDGGGSVKMYVV